MEVEVILVSQITNNPNSTTMKKFFVFSILLIGLNACKKDDKKALSKSDYLTAGKWMITAAVSDEDGDGVYEINDFADFEDCFKDNFITFHGDGKVVLDEGETKCVSTDPQSETDFWQLTNNESSLVIDSDTYSIEQLDANLLVVKLSYGGNISSKVTFSKR
jgi:hypothetical protein